MLNEAGRAYIRAATEQTPVYQRPDGTVSTTPGEDARRIGELAGDGEEWTHIGDVAGDGITYTAPLTLGPGIHRAGPRRGRVFWHPDRGDGMVRGTIDLGGSDEPITLTFPGSNPEIGAATLHRGDELTITYDVTGEPDDQRLRIFLSTWAPPQTAQLSPRRAAGPSGPDTGWWLPERYLPLADTAVSIGVEYVAGEYAAAGYARRACSWSGNSRQILETLRQFRRELHANPDAVAGRAPDGYHNPPAPPPVDIAAPTPTPAPGQTPGQASAGGVLDNIDNVVEGRCACGCGATITDVSPSAFYATQDCQTRWMSARTTDPEQVQNRPDAALVWVGQDDRRVDLGPSWSNDPFAGFRAPTVAPAVATAMGMLAQTVDRHREAWTAALGMAAAIPDTRPDVFECPTCGRRSVHPADIEHGYCSACREFTRAHETYTMRAAFHAGGIVTPGRNWWVEDLADVIAYRRFCPTCNERRTVDLYSEATPNVVSSFGSHRPVRSTRVDRQRCSSCRHTWPGPIYEWGYTNEVDPRDAYRLMLQRGRWSADLRIAHNVLHPHPDPRGFVDDAWHRLERVLWDKQRGRGRRVIL